MTAEAGQPEVYPNLQAVLTRPIDWQVYHRLTLGHGSGRDDFETLKTVTFLNSLLSSSQPSEVVVCSSSARNSRSAGETRAERRINAPKGRRNSGSLNSTVASKPASTSSRTAFSGTMETPFSISTARLTVSMLSNSSTSFTFTPSDRSLRSISRRVGKSGAKAMNFSSRNAERGIRLS